MSRESNRMKSQLEKVHHRLINKQNKYKKLKKIIKNMKTCWILTILCLINLNQKVLKKKKKIESKLFKINNNSLAVIQMQQFTVILTILMK